MEFTKASNIHIYKNGSQPEKMTVLDLVEGKIFVPGLEIFGELDDIENYLNKKGLYKKFGKNYITSYNYDSSDLTTFQFEDEEVVSQIRDLTNLSIDDYDIIIVGYGTTSSCIVEQLNETNLKVLVLNNGPCIKDDNVRYLKNFNTVWKNPKYTTVIGVSETDNNVTQGRIMGGSSMHNGCVAIKPTKNYLSNLHGNYNHELPIEINSPINNENNDNTGLEDIIIEAISGEFEIPIVENHNEYDFSISKNTQMFIKKNGERAMVVDLLDKLHSNIKVIEGTCEKLEIDKGKVIGIHCTINGKTFYLKADNIILSAGVMSSIILEKSGIGSKNILENAGVECLLDNHNVGSNVKNQVGPSICMRFPEKYKTNSSNELGSIGMGFAPKFLQTVPNQKNDRKYQIMVTKYPFLKESISKLYNLQGTISINICDLKPKSSGTINIVSSNSQPLINLATYKENEDVDSGILSLIYLLNIYKKIKESIPDVELVFPTQDIINKIEMRDLLSIDSLVTEHYTSSCRMGSTIENSVVGFDFKVHSMENLFICDASVFPFCPDGNPQYACMLLGMELGERIKRNF